MSVEYLCQSMVAAGLNSFALEFGTGSEVTPDLEANLVGEGMSQLGIGTGSGVFSMVAAELIMWMPLQYMCPKLAASQSCR